jgi:hypothetical protein
MQTSRRSNKTKSRRSRVRRSPLPLTGRIRESSQFFVDATLTAGTSAFVNLRDMVTASSYSPHLVALGAAYQFYRFSDLKIFVNPFGVSGSSADTYLAVGYQPFQQDLAPSVHEIVNMPRSMLMTATQTVPLPFIVPRRFLMGQTSMKWWRVQLPSQTTPAAGNPLPTSNLYDSVQGCFWFVADTNQSFTFRVQYTVEFQAPEDSGRLLGLERSMEQLQLRTSEPVVAAKPLPPTLCRGHGAWIK